MVRYELKLYLNRLTYLLGAGQAGDVASTTGNCYLTAVSIAIGSLGELL